MSHKTTMSSELKDIDLLKATATELGCGIKTNMTVEFFSESARGTSIQLKGWKYPIVIDSNGKIFYDNYGGRWGDVARLNEFKQQYSAQAIIRQVRASGGKLVHTSTEMKNGKIVMTLADRW